MQRILVTGGNGQLGSQLKEYNSLYPDIEFLFTDLPELDITNETQIEAVLSSFTPSWIINCAAYTAVDLAETEIDAATRLNSDAPALLARLSSKYHIRLVHISTDYVFDGKGYFPYKEDHPKHPAGIYAQSKSLGEDLVMANNPTSIIVRTSWLYSIYGKNFLKTVLRLAKDKGSMRIVSDQVGTPTWTGDLAKAVMKMIELNANPAIYHYSNEGVCSWYDFAKAITEIQEIECTIEPIFTSEYPLPAPRPFYSVLDKTLFKTTSGTSIPHWRDSLKLCLDQLYEQG
jgi:dTDP-4-dehydrorhamnose reductase